MTLQQQFESGRSHHQAGRLAEAERIYRQILAQQPEHADALHLLGVLAGQAGKLDAAVELMRRAIRLKPDLAGAHSNLGNVLLGMGRLDEAIASSRQAVRLKPDLAEAHYNMGVALQRKGQLDEAIAAYRQAIQFKPDYTEAHGNLGNALKDKGQVDEALAAYRQAVRLKPDFADAHSNLGNVLQTKGQLDEAVASHRQAIRLKPDFADAYSNLGSALRDKGQLDEAIECLRQAIRLKPGLAEAHSNLGNALRARGQLDEAIASSRQAVRLKPDLAEAHNNLANALKDRGQLAEAIAAYCQAIRLKPDLAEAHNNLGKALKDRGQLDEAIASHRQAIGLKPDYAEAHADLGAVFAVAGRLDEAIAACRSAIQLKSDNSDNYAKLLYAFYHHPDYDSGRLLEETRQWMRKALPPQARRQAVVAATSFPARDRTRERLKIGYLSPFFGACADAHFIFPLLAHHDRKQFEIFCYTRATRDDELTDRLRPLCDHWLDIRRLGIAKSAELIRGHGIDILVNMSRPADECLLIMAHRLAPIQITWLTFASCTTGLETMDYRISDPYLDPVGMDEHCYAEKTLRLPQTAWCYDPLLDPPPVKPLPAMTNRFITFGSLNRLSKINPSVVAAWAEILRAVPNSRLHLLAGLGSHRQRLLDQFRERGVDPRRIEFIDRQPRMEYLKQYDRIDITLNTFPFSGHTTTLDSLWMGVPVVTLSGRTSVGRAASSALHNLGLSEWIGRTAEQYVSLAVGLSGDVAKLAELRAGLRGRMEASSLMDAPRFARNVEAAYRQMWRTWCEAGGNSSLQCPAP